MPAASALFSTQLPSFCDVSTSAGTDLLVSLVRAIGTQGTDEAISSLVCRKSALSFVNSAFLLTTFLLPIVGVGSIVGDDGEEIRGRDGSVEYFCGEECRDRFRSDIEKFSEPNSMPTTDYRLHSLALHVIQTGGKKSREVKQVANG